MKRGISIDAFALAMIVVDVIEKGGGIAEVADRTGLKPGAINQRLVGIRKNYPMLKDSLSFPKGGGTGKKGATATRMTEEQLALLTGREQAIADLTEAPPETVQENGMSLVRKNDVSAEDHAALMTEVEKNTAL